MIEEYLEEILKEILTSPLVSSFKVIRREIAENKGEVFEVEGPGENLEAER